jgi:hypothetical protein
MTNINSILSKIIPLNKYLSTSIYLPSLFTIWDYLSNVLSTSIYPLYCQQVFIQYIVTKYLSNILSPSIYPIYCQQVFIQCLVDDYLFTIWDYLSTCIYLMTRRQLSYLMSC